MRALAAEGIDDVGKVAYGVLRMLPPTVQDDPFAREAIVSIVGMLRAASGIDVRSE